MASRLWTKFDPLGLSEEDANEKVSPLSARNELLDYAAPGKQGQEASKDLFGTLSAGAEFAADMNPIESARQAVQGTSAFNEELSLASRGTAGLGAGGGAFFKAPKWLKRLFKSGKTGKVRKEMLDRVRQATLSKNPADRAEGIVARALKNDLVDGGFNRKFDASGLFKNGEIDVETKQFIIEVATSKTPRKTKQIEKLLGSSVANPSSKKVILFAPNIPYNSIVKHREAGAIVVKTIDELKSVIDTAK